MNCQLPTLIKGSAEITGIVNENSNNNGEINNVNIICDRKRIVFSCKT